VLKGLQQSRHPLADSSGRWISP